MLYMLIEDGRIRDLYTLDPELQIVENVIGEDGPTLVSRAATIADVFHSDLTWIEAPPGAAIGMAWDGEELGPLPSKLVPIAWEHHAALADDALKTARNVQLRCIVANVPVPKDWNDYAVALEKISKSPDGDAAKSPLPVKPKKPDGI